ncbi:hypothetical protein GGR53DRAFT_466635 [Hypoxylon sp. FL1150]|nr:hypothetical protein GGR53DRAFT_466635 [Hypoxylon sp. FL1150]
MAAGLLIDPITLLRFAPVISSTYIGRQRQDAALVRRHLLQSRAPRVVGLLLTTILTSAANTRYAPGQLLHERGSFIWYSSAITFALGHHVYFPLILPYIKAVKGDAKEKNVNELRNWFYVHNWRTLAVDLAGWVCCIVAAVKTVSP